MEVKSTGEMFSQMMLAECITPPILHHIPIDLDKLFIYLQVTHLTYFQSYVQFKFMVAFIYYPDKHICHMHTYLLIQIMQHILSSQ